MRLQVSPASPFFPKISLMPRAFLATVLSFALMFSLGFDVSAAAATPATAKDKKSKQDPSLKGLPITELSADEAILHVLNRLAYGPRPGDVERVRQMGLAKWIEEQLNPGSIDDKALGARLENYPTLQLSTAKLIDEYPQPKQAAKLAGLTKEEFKTQQAEKRRSDAMAERDARDLRAEQGKDVKAQQQNAEGAVEKQEMNDAPSPMKMDQPRGKLAANGGGARNALGGGDPNNVPRAIADDSKRPQRIVAELGMAKVTRAIYSNRQLQQVMDDFWFNHFNVFAGKGEDRYYLTSYERDVIQPHALGKFKDLLTATAKSPAMLFYLDNFLSADPKAAQRMAAERAMRQQRRRGRFGGPWPSRPAANPQQGAKKNERGLNENYGRELMELHTLGVDGGYTQKDVTEVARCFTGWTLERPRQYPEFRFDERLHDPDPKYVLGKKIHAGGMKDGEQVLDLLDPRARIAAACAEYARKRGKFWEMNRLLFEHQEELDDANLKSFAQQLKLDGNDMLKEAYAGKFEAIIERHLKEGAAAEVQATPSLFLNGRLHTLPVKLEYLRHSVEDELEWQRNGGAWDKE